MKPEQACFNHPNVEMASHCHYCGGKFCLECLIEGSEYYYCRKPECESALNKEKGLKRGKCHQCGWNILIGSVFCPSCGSQLRELTEQEKRDDLETVARYNFPSEAQLARTKLESEGIESFVADEHIIAIDPLLNYAIGGVRLQVRKSELNRAFLILQGL